MEAIQSVTLGRDDREAHFTTQQLCVMGAAGAASFLLQTFLKLPTPFAEFLKYDPSDVPPILCALAMGPGAGFLTVLVRVLLKLMVFGGDPIGLGMNLIASGSFAMVVGALARYPTGLWTQLGALGAATVVMTLVMLPVNFYVLRFGNYVPEGQVVSMLCLGITPFNLMKGITNSLIVLALWQHLRPDGKSLEG
jgi:riboflavin transporter FmnP